MKVILGALPCCILLTSCGGGGGGGGGVSNVPTPITNPTPTPVPSATQAIDAPQTSQVFSAVGAQAHSTYDISTATIAVKSGTNAAAKIDVSYDAETKSYTVAMAGSSQRFMPTDAKTSNFGGEALYSIMGSETREFLTLAFAPYSGGAQRKFVALGYWERISRVGATQDSDLDMFAYGFRTTDGAVPRTGYADYNIDVFGLLATPGKEPKVISGAGLFQVDFLSAIFNAKALVGEYSLTSDFRGGGGKILVDSAGTLASNNGFNGNLSYSGFDGQTVGSLTGAFFGPNGEELGGAFWTSNSTGAHLTGALTGAKNSSVAPTTLALTNLLADTSLNVSYSEIKIAFDTGQSPVFRAASGNNLNRYWEPGKINFRLDGNLTVQRDFSRENSIQLTDLNKSIVQRSNFISYDGVQVPSSLNVGGAVHFDLYKVGSANTEIKLSYTSFGIWDQPYINGGLSVRTVDFLLFGLPTKDYVLGALTGSATYDGIVYGLTTTSAGDRQDVGGTSRFNVDFGSQRFSGALNLTASSNGGPASLLGAWSFADQMVNGQLVHTALNPGSGSLDIDSITPHFYGPTGEEIGATFSISNGVVSPGGIKSITGVTVAVRK